LIDANVCQTLVLCTPALLHCQS